MGLTLSRFGPVKVAAGYPFARRKLVDSVLYQMSLNPCPDGCSGVANETRDQVLRSASTITQRWRELQGERHQAIIHA